MSVVKIKIRGKQVFATQVAENKYVDIFGKEYLVTDRVKSSIHRTRNVPEEIKKKFKEIDSLYKKRSQLEKKYKLYQDNFHKEMQALNHQIDEAAFEARTSIGLLSDSEFEQEVLRLIPALARREIENKGFQVDTPTNIGYRDGYLYLSYGKLITKYFRKSSFTYVEYDGTIHFIDDAEKTDEYKRYLRQNRKKLDCVLPSVKFQECLGMGDKDSLSYSCCYEIPLPDVLTKESAAELVKKVFQTER